jgi:very-short-patch-repair endonuclease
VRSRDTTWTSGQSPGRIGPYICVFIDQRSRSIAEIDGREFRSEASVFRQDRRRQNWLDQNTLSASDIRLSNPTIGTLSTLA